MTKAMLLLIVAVLAVVATLIAPAVGAKEPSKGTSSITLPERPNEIPAFVAELDDKQARSTLVKVLEERTKPAEAEKLDLFTAAKRATSRIASPYGTMKQRVTGKHSVCASTEWQGQICSLCDAQYKV